MPSCLVLPLEIGTGSCSRAHDLGRARQIDPLFFQGFDLFTGFDYLSTYCLLIFV